MRDQPADPGPRGAGGRASMEEWSEMRLSRGDGGRAARDDGAQLAPPPPPALPPAPGGGSMVPEAPPGMFPGLAPSGGT
eukprot:gene29520-67289_t